MTEQCVKKMRLTRKRYPMLNFNIGAMENTKSNPKVPFAFKAENQMHPIHLIVLRKIYSVVTLCFIQSDSKARETLDACEFEALQTRGDW